MFLGFANRVFAKVEDACGQHSISLSRAQDIGEVLKFACAAACYDGDSHRLRNCARQLEIISSTGAVRIHACEEDFSRTSECRFDNPFDGISLSGLSAAVGVDSPFSWGVTLGIYSDNHTLRTKCLGRFADEFRSLKSGGIYADFVGPRAKHRAKILHGPNAPANSQWHETLLGRSFDHRKHRRPAITRGSDIQKDKLIGSLHVIQLGTLNRVACIAEVQEFCPFYHTTISHIQTRNHSLCQHEPNNPRLVSEIETKMIAPAAHRFLLSCVF